MNEEKAPYVTNAADEKQVKKAKMRQKDKEKRRVHDMQFVLEMPEGRRVLWRILEDCGVFKSIWESSARIHYNSGQQDLGHKIMANIVEANEEAFFKMMKEAKDDV